RRLYKKAKEQPVVFVFTETLLPLSEECESEDLIDESTQYETKGIPK
ncbi:unnamed protein product, partial [Rotaria socialis]